MSAERFEPFPGDLNPESASAQRCTWHTPGNQPCPRPPRNVVRTKDGRHWSACEAAVREIAAKEGVPLPADLA